MKEVVSRIIYVSRSFPLSCGLCLELLHYVPQCHPLQPTPLCKNLALVTANSFVFVCMCVSASVCVWQPFFSAAFSPLILRWHGKQAAGGFHSNLPSFVTTCPCDTHPHTPTLSSTFCGGATSPTLWRLPFWFWPKNSRIPSVVENPKPFRLFCNITRVKPAPLKRLPSIKMWPRHRAEGLHCLVLSFVFLSSQKLYRRNLFNKASQPSWCLNNKVRFRSDQPLWLCS